MLSNYELKNFTLRIYNHWGQCVFYKTDYRQGWDGSGQDMGTFFYGIEYEHPFSHQMVTMKGDVTLVQ